MAYQVGRCLLRSKLENSKMSQRQLAEKMGIRVQQINKYVLNKQIMTLPVAKNIAHILNCQIDDLYEWIETGDNE